VRHCTSLVAMPKKDTKDNSSNAASMKTLWTSADEALLVTTLLEEKHKGNWGDNNPKKQAWVACEAALAGLENATNSCRKDVSSIKSCWQQVSTPCTLKYMCAHGYCSSNDHMTASSTSVNNQDGGGITRKPFQRSKTMFGKCMSR